MKAKFQKILNQRNLTLKKIDHVSKLIPQELMKTGLDHESVDQIIAGAKLCGGLAQFTDLLEKEKMGLEGDINELHQIRTTLENRIARQQYELYILNQECNDSITRKNRAINQMEEVMDATEQHVAEAKNKFAALTENRQRVIDEIKALLREYSKDKTELEAAAVFFKLLEEPHNIATYDLRELVKKLNLIVDIRRGKAKHLSYYLDQISESARKKLIDTCANLLKDDFVSITKYRDVEKKNMKLKSKYKDLQQKYQNMIDTFNQKLKQLENEIRNEMVPRWKYELKRPQARRISRVSER
jgi:chromosome segregation ATPase